MRYIIGITYLDALDVEQVVYYGTDAFTTSGTDAPAHTTVEDRIVNPALVRRDIFDVGTTGGASRVGYGDLVLRNDDGALDWLLDRPIDGRNLTIYVATDTGVANFPADYDTITLTMDQPEGTQSEVTVRIRDRQVVTSRNLQDNLYGGTNVLPNGVDGIASDLKNKPKPILYGRCFNVTPIFVNTSRNVYQVNDGPVRDVTAVYDSGALLAHGLDYASEAEMMANVPAAGTFRVWKAGGMFRIGTSADGLVTCDAVEGQWPKDRTAAQVYYRLLTERATVSSGQISATDLTTLDAQQPASLGFYANDNITVAAALDQVATSVGAWWSTDIAGQFRLVRLELPSGEPVLDLTAEDFKQGTIKRLPLTENAIPSYQTTVRCVPNWTVQEQGLVEGVRAARRSRLANPYQDASSLDAGVRTQYLLSQERVVNTLIVCLTAGVAEAARLQTLYGVRRDRYDVTIQADAATLAALDLGVVVRMTYDRFGLDAGQLFRVIGYQLNPVDGIVSLTVWG